MVSECIVRPRGAAHRSRLTDYSGRAAALICILEYCNRQSTTRENGHFDKHDCKSTSSLLPYTSPSMSLVAPDPSQNFNHILRLLNTNVDGKGKIMYALTKITGVGRRYANIVCKKADVDLGKR